MKFFIEKAILINRAPFENLTLNFYENEIVVLTAVNGRGKTTLLSYLVDAFHEIARPHFPNEFESKANQLYRISSTLHNIDSTKPSFVYLRFKIGNESVDYLDIRNNCSEELYNEAINIENKIPYGEFSQALQENSFTKTVSSNFDSKKAKLLFSNNIATYFPSYRFEVPGYLNNPYKTTLDFKKNSGFSGFLPNPIEVVTGLPQLANWIMDIVLDMRITGSAAGNEAAIFANLNRVISETLVSKGLGNLRFGIGQRGLGGTRIQIVKSIDGQRVYPTIFNLSAGESSLLCLFGELLRQADNYRYNLQLNAITGIVLVDEVDKHLHIRLQKEVLPRLFSLFPNVQFILSSHSPFLSMGLAESLLQRSKVFDLDNLGVSHDPYTSDLYKEVYEMMIKENERFKEQFFQIEQLVNQGTQPLIITEGKTDVQHLRKAKDALGLNDMNIEFYEINGDWGDSKLKILLEQLAKVPQSRKIIGIFDRDVQSIVTDIESGGRLFKNYGNNVFSFCIPIPNGRENYPNISIEFYYTDDEIKKDSNGKSLYFDNEVDYLHNKSTGRPEVRKLNEPRLQNENSKKIFDEQKMCEVADWIHSKATFARLVELDLDFTEDFDFSNFRMIFDRIGQIIQTN